jgi:amino acid adenylation domain-containing protein
MSAVALDNLPSGSSRDLRTGFQVSDSEADRERCVHSLIARWAAHTPSAPAVSYEGTTLSYGQLNQRANRLARHLRGLGIGIGSLVGVSMKRCPEMIVGLLGILKAGAAYVPLDPRLPRERLQFLVSDAPLPLILTCGACPAADPAVIVDLKDLDPAALDADDFDSGVASDDLVYVIYTSGSTGQPKGAMIPHRGLVNWLVWMRRAFDVTPADVVLKKAPLTFDVSAWELFLPLISGACLVLADSDRQFDPRYLAELMARTRVTIAQFVPSLMRHFFELDDLPDLSALRHVMCGGEVLTPKLQAQFLERLHAELCNSYGPTEASIGVTRWPCRRGDDRPYVPIGYAIDNTELYILDPDLNPVPPGEAGELYIGGVCVGWGYLNRPDLTAERFLPNPFNPDGHARMYRTGDLCRFLGDGSIDFLGRMDDQVKVRGVRIELAEVEKALGAHPGIEIAAVAAEERDEETFLCAYVVPGAGKALSERELRAFLRTKLPLSMIPSEFLFVESLPLSANGKIDRKSLKQFRAPARPALAAPRDEIEQQVIVIWKELLNTEDFGAQDDFFDCGGDSLSAVTLIMRIESTFERCLDFDHLLGGLTVAGIANAVRAGVPEPVASASPAIRNRVGSDMFCRVAEFDDIPGIWQVCKQAFPAYADCRLEDFRELCRHRWLENPFRTDLDPFGWVLEAENGKILGFHGLVPIPLWLGGRSCHAVSPTTWATEPGHGKAGLSLLSTYMNWGTERFLLNTTANAITSAMHESGAFGMKRIPLADFDQRLVWVRDFKSLLRWKAAQPDAPALLHHNISGAPIRAIMALAAPFAIGFAGGGRAALRAGLRGMKIQFPCRPLPVEQVSAFGAEFDRLWNRLKHRYAVTMERSAALLNWRHRNTPRLLGPSFALACRDAGGELLGYVALREPINMAPGHVIMTDLFYDQDNPDVLGNLMNAAFAFAASRSASVFEVFGFHPALNKILLSQHPYLLRRSLLERLGRDGWLGTILAALDRRGRDASSATYWYRAPTAELDAICSQGTWWPSGIDGDLNL